MKKIFKVTVLVIGIAVIFQWVIRYKTVNLDGYDLRDDRLTLTVYAKPTESSVWRETRFKSLNQAKVYFEKKILREQITGERFLWWEEIPNLIIPM